MKDLKIYQVQVSWEIDHEVKNAICITQALDSNEAISNALAHMEEREVGKWQYDPEIPVVEIDRDEPVLAVMHIDYYE